MGKRVDSQLSGATIFEALDKTVQRYMIQAQSKHAGSYRIYLDFSEVYELSRDKRELPPIGQIKKELPFSGLVGYFSYEFLCSFCGYSPKAKKDLDLPDGLFARPETVISINGEEIIIESSLAGREEELVEIVNSCGVGADDCKQGNCGEEGLAWVCNLEYEEYEKIFHEAREQILDGNTYQIKISQRYESAFELKVGKHFAQLMKVNSAPESFAVRWDNFAMVSCSPETVIDLQGQKIMTRPIGGTLDRAKTGKGDPAGLEEIFYSNEKEVFEHNMLIDLERNDLSRVCKAGTVSIDKYRNIETYAHVHHLVSTISGELKAGVRREDIIQSMLPGGTVTGCPKMKTLQLIDRFEKCFRGPYTGSFGLLHDSGDMHLNLIIRTLISVDKKCYVQAGGGIVINSTPEYEYNENRIKAQALMELVG